MYTMVDVQYFSEKFVAQRKIGQKGRVFIMTGKAQ